MVLDITLPINPYNANLYIFCLINGEDPDQLRGQLIKIHSFPLCMYRGNNLHHNIITWMLQTRSMTPSLIYTVSFSLRKIIQISVCQNLAVQVVPNIPLGQNI